jgi:hypothetical protein
VRFINRFVSPVAPPRQELAAALRNHPLLAAAGAASGGVLVGMVFTVQVLGVVAGPPGGRQPADPRRVESAMVAASSPAPHIAETTGAAVASDAASTADCSQETWPDLSPNCVGSRRVRVVSPRGAGQSTAASVAPLPPPRPADSAQPVVTGPPQPPPAAEPVSPVKETAKAETRSPRHVAKKSRAKPKTVARRERDHPFWSEDDDFTDRADRASRDSMRERHRGVRAYGDERDDSRRVRRRVVIQRDEGPFGSLFGDFGGDSDD